MTGVYLETLLLESKDGEWGNGEQVDDSQEMIVIRGTDFDSVRVGNLADLPRRFVSNRIAKRKTMQPDDIIIETAGGSKNRPTGRTVFIKERHLADVNLPITCASFARFLRIDPSKADPGYVYYVLQHMYVAGVLRKYHTQHTGVARFQYTAFAKSEPLPIFSGDTQRQRRISALLFSYDDLIENNARRIKILEEMALSLYREWFVYFRFPGHEKTRLVDSSLGKIPQDWSPGQLGDVLTLQRGFDLPERERRSGEVPIISSSGATGFHDIAKVDPPGVVTGRYGTLGEVFLIDEPFWPLNTTLFVRDFKGSDPHYVAHMLRSLDFGRQNAAGAVPGVNRNALHLLQVVIPPSKVQVAFGLNAGLWFQAAKNYRARNANLRKTRDLLLPKLISGEIDVSNLPLDPTS